MWHITVADVITVISALVAIELAIGHGTITLTNAIPEKNVPAVQAWCNILAGVGSIVITFLSRMVTVLLVAIVVLGPARPADAATLAQPAAPIVKATPTSAPPVVACTVNSCTGFYAGADIIGDATNVNVFLNGIVGSLNAGGTELGIHGGYRAWNGTVYLGGEVGCSYNISQNIGAVGSSPSDMLRCMELLKAGGALSALFNGQANPVQFTFPQALQSSFMSFYAILGGAQRLSKTGLAAGVGAEFVLMPQWTLNLEYINTQYGGGGASQSSAVAIPSENLFRLGLSYNF